MTEAEKDPKTSSWPYEAPLEDARPTRTLTADALVYLNDLCSREPTFRKTMQDLCVGCFGRYHSVYRAAMSRAIRHLRMRGVHMLFKDLRTGFYFKAGPENLEVTQRKYDELRGRARKMQIRVRKMALGAGISAKEIDEMEADAKRRITLKREAMTVKRLRMSK